MIDYKWRVTLMNVADIEGVGSSVVTQIFFELHARETVTGQEQALVGSFSPADVEPGASLIPYDDLSEDVVTAWLEAMPAAAEYKQLLADVLSPVSWVPAALPWNKE